MCKQRLFLRFIPLLMCLFLCACEYKPRTESETETTPVSAPVTTPAETEPLVKTETLVIYQPPWRPLEELIKSALYEFMMTVPDVKIDLRTFPDMEIEEFYKILGTELAAGKGPDLVFWINGLPGLDFYKTLDAGLFADLNPLIDADEFFPWDDLNKPVLDAGLYKGERLFVPLGYYVNMFVTAQETLDALEIPMVPGMSLADFSDALAEFAGRYEGNDNYWLYPYSQGGSYLVRSGLAFVDFTSKTVNVRTEEFRTVIELCKTDRLFMGDRQMEDYNDGADVEAIRENRMLLAPVGGVMFPKTYSGLAPSYTPVFLPMPNAQGEKLVATFAYTASIPKSGGNRYNAYRFFKILLSEKIQGSAKISLGIPVSHAGLLREQAFYHRMKDYKNRSGTVQYVFPEQAAIDEYNRLLTDVVPTPPISGDAYTMVINYMEPYFNGAKSYESCLSELENALRLYISE